MPSFIERLRAHGFTSYQDYLESDLWRKNRQRLTLRQRCWVCDKKWGLAAHHMTYDRVCLEIPGDVVMLCNPCHKSVHDFAKRYRLKLWNAHVSFKRFKETGEYPPQKPRKKKPKQKNIGAPSGLNTRLGKKRYIKAQPVTIKRLW